MSSLCGARQEANLIYTATSYNTSVCSGEEGNIVQYTRSLPSRHGCNLSNLLLCAKVQCEQAVGVSPGLRAYFP
jgi:hypothetical protein